VPRKLLPDILCYNPRRPMSFPQSWPDTDEAVDVFFSKSAEHRLRGREVVPFSSAAVGNFHSALDIYAQERESDRE
jgi:hypothetical protein